MKEQESIGPFKAVGVLLNTVGSAAVVVDQSIKTGGGAIVSTLSGIDMVMQKGNEALELALEGPIEDLKCDKIVDDAHRTVRIAQAKAEAARIIAALETPTNTKET